LRQNLSKYKIPKKKFEKSKSPLTAEIEASPETYNSDKFGKIKIF